MMRVHNVYKKLLELTFLIALLIKQLSHLIVDTRFEQYEQYENIFGFLFTSDILHSLDDSYLKSCCIRLEEARKNGEKYDICGYNFYEELKLI